MTVAEFNTSVQGRIEEAFPAVWIVGEVSNLNRYSSGHCYFTLKDAGSEIASVLFVNAARRLSFLPADGVEVLACGRPSLWVPRGRYQFIVEVMEPRGRGSLLEAFEELKRKLLAEGLFESSRKRPLPVLPARIGVVTSLDGAAFRDILEVLSRRHAGVDVLLAPARVQGTGAADEIAAAIGALGAWPGVDVIIVGRGGGSIEDLWAFNEERVARAIADCPVPVISAVGHETDVTIADFAADLRAATPSQAAEMVVASRADLLDRLESCGARLGAATRLRLSQARRALEGLASRPRLAEVPARIAARGQLLDDHEARLRRASHERLERCRRLAEGLALRLAPRHLTMVVRSRRDSETEMRRLLSAVAVVMVRGHQRSLERLGSLLRSLSPLAVLDRGYAICLDGSTSRVIRSHDQVSAGDAVDVRLARGALDCRVRAPKPPPDQENVP